MRLSLPEGENTASEPGEVPSEKALEDITAENTEDKQDTDGAENGGEQ